MVVQMDWEFFRAQLPSDFRELAVERGLIQPQLPQLKTKITDIEPVLRIILHRAGLEVSLATTASEAATAQVIELSSVAIHKWERRLAPYLAELSTRLLDAGTGFAPGTWAGYDVRLVDATVVTRPGAEGTTARVHYVLRLADLRVLRAVVTNEHGGETLRNHEDLVEPGQLWIADRIYANPPGIAAIVGQGGQVLVRYNRGSLPLYDAEGKRFDVLEQVRTLRRVEAVSEWPVWIHPKEGERIRGRLCALRLPDEKAEEARARLRREEGNKVTRESLETAAWVIVFTTVPRSRMKAGCVLQLYRLRWQVELEIKRDKSIGGLSRLPNFREDTIATWLQAKLLIHFVAQKIASSAGAFPPSAVQWPILAFQSSPCSAPRRSSMAHGDLRLRGHPRRPDLRPAA
jgi:hypothetical protein